MNVKLDLIYDKSFIKRKCLGEKSWPFTRIKVLFCFFLSAL